jgi:hypothetical protein
MAGDSVAKHRGITVRVYCKVLKEHLLRVLSESSIFMHDSVPIYTAKIIKASLEDKSIKIIA